MALIGHYPLINDVKDYTMNANHGQALGAYFESSEKFGSAAKFTLDSDRIVIPHSDLLSKMVFGSNDTFSVSVWAYITELPPATHFGVLVSKAEGSYFSNATTAIWIDSTGNVYYLIGTNQAGNPPGSTVTVATTITINTWNHFVMTCDGTAMRAHLNGVWFNSAMLQGSHILPRTENTADITIGPRIKSTANSKLRGYVADLRLYDHTLSIQEVKELAKAKVVHYKFNSFQEPVYNRAKWDDWLNLLVIGSNVTQGNIKATRLSQTRFKFEVVADYTGILELELGILGQVAYSYTHTLSATVVEYKMAVGSATNIGIARYKANHTYVLADLISGANGYNRQSLSLSVTSGGLGTTYTDKFALVSPTGLMKAGSYIIIDEVQSERSAYATPFTNESTPARIPDLSGYGRDITSSAENPIDTDWRFPRWVADKNGMGVGHYDFITNKGKMMVPYGNSIFPAVQPITITAWVVPKTYGESTILFGSTNGTNQRFYVGIIDGKWSIGIKDLPWNAASAVSMVDGKLTHIAMVLDGLTAKLYVDTALSRTVSYTTYQLSSNIYIGTNGDDQYRWVGTISEFAIYRSALSVSDIKDLYQRRASLDEYGSMTAVQFESTIGLEYYGVTNSFTPTNCTRSLADGNLSIVATTQYPSLTTSLTSIFYRNLVMMDNSRFNKFEVKYRIRSGGATSLRVAFNNARDSEFNQTTSYIQLNTNGNWDEKIIDLSTHPYWAHSPVSSFRIELFTSAGAEIDFRFFRFLSSDKQVSVGQNGIVKARGFMERGPLNGLNSWWPLNGPLKELINSNMTTVSTYGTTKVVSFLRGSGHQSDGTAYIIAPTPGGFVNPAKGAFSFWVYVDESQSMSVPFTILSSKETPKVGGGVFAWIKLRNNTDGSDSFSLIYETANGSCVTTIQYATDWFIRKYTHVVIQYADSNNGMFIDVYLNGNYVATNIPTVAQLPGFESTELYFLGNGVAEGTGTITKGKITDFRYYGRFLSEIEINLLYELSTQSKNMMKYLNTGELYIKGRLKEVY